MKKLKLNKETLIHLQEKQMQSLVGGDAVMMSFGESAQYTCPIPQGDSCCKKTCRGKKKEVHAVE